MKTYKPGNNLRPREIEKLIGASLMIKLIH